MKIAVLETGRPPEELVGRFGTYPEMYRRMLGLAELASYDQRDAAGFIRLNALRLRTLASRDRKAALGE